MYLARTLINGSNHYSIRQSFFDDSADIFRYRTLFDLGVNPSKYVHLIDDEFCYFSSELESDIGQFTKKDPSDLLEELLWDFLPIEVRHRLSVFRGRSYSRRSAINSEEKKQIEKQVHLFDRRRVYYLRLGAVDQTRIDRMPIKLCRPLLGQCRDEREFYFRKQELSLRPAELKSYVFAVFDLQRYFSQTYSAFMPEGLNQHQIDEFFVKELCRLNKDKRFWGTQTDTTTLHEHLIHYLIMFFDYEFGHGIHTNEYIRQFMHNHRAFRWPKKKVQVSDEQVKTLFGKSKKELEKLERTELIRLFRKKAKKLHPDKGGDHEQFVLLVEIYNGLLKK